MEIVFEKEYLRELYQTGKTNNKRHRFQPQIIKGYVKCVIALDEAAKIEDLYHSKALNYEKLQGDKKGLSSLRINNQYRLKFKEISDSAEQIIICSLKEITNHYK